MALILAPATLATAGTQRTWDYAPFCWVRRAAAEKGAPPNAHPARIAPAAVSQALGSLRFVAGGEAPLFAPAELAVMAPAVSEALALAGPGEDLELMSTWKREGGLLTSSKAVTARIFFLDGKLNVIVNDARLDYHYDYNLTDRMPDFQYGTRKKAGETVLKAPGAEARRADWVAFLPGAAPAPAAAVQPGVAPPLPAQAPPPVRPPKPALDPTSSVEERLRALKRFRDQDLITEEEYVRQKQELLREFVQGPAK